MGAAAAALSPAQTAEIRTAFIGVGIRGGSLVRQVLKQENVRITAICDTDPQARDGGLTVAQRDNPRGFSDYRAMLDFKDIDAIYIATPCDLHSPMAIACLQAGKHVYCEKPLGVTAEQVQQAYDAAKKASTVFQIGQQLRYMPRFREAIRQIHEEKVAGQTFVIKAQRHSTPPEQGKERARPQWYLDVKRSGDLIVENAVHNIDVCNWVANSRPVSAYGFGKKYLPAPIPAGTMMMDGFSVQYIYENEMHLDYSQLYLHPRALKDLQNNQWYMIFGEKGTVDLSKGLFYPMHADAPREIVKPEIMKANENAISEFYSAIREKRRPFADVTVGAVAALTTIMGREAIYRKRMVTWKELGAKV
jgi:predicted dehydrogenase